MPGGPNQNLTRKVEVFRPGSFRAMSGGEYTFSEGDVAAIAAAYDAEAAPAPVVVGHPQHDDPAFGWAKGFSVNDDGVLVAEIGDLAPAFVSAVEEGRYRKVSMKFFAPDAPNNPAPGKYYPRHIGFLGGAAPAVSGLSPVQFSDSSEEGLVEIVFAEPAMEDVASLFRSIREFFIEKFGRDAANSAVPEYLIRWVDDAADEPAQPSPGFIAPEEKETPMSGDQASLDARAADLEKRERALRNAENVSFAEGLIGENKLLPAMKPQVVALLDQLATDTEAEIAFSDGGEDKTSSPADLFKAILSAQPEVVPAGKTDLGEDPGSGDVSFAAPDGFKVDADGLDLHAKALAYQRVHPGTDYIDAALAVQEG